MLKTILRPALVGMVLLFTVIGAHAATLTVSTTSDSGPGSLRQAILDATTNAEANTVAFNIPVSDPGYDVVGNRFTITLASALPSFPLAPFSMSNTQIHALTVSGNAANRVFTLVNSAVVSITNITIANGNSTVAANIFSDRSQWPFGDVTAGYGGAIYMGNSSTLTLNNCVINGSHADFNGGAIYMGDSSTLEFNTSEIRNNTAAQDGGGIYMSNSTTAHVTRSTIRDNTAPVGGGGAVYIFNSGTLNIDSSTVSTNSSVKGGGVYNGTSATINATSNTFHGNAATGGDAATDGGGAIYNTGTITFINNTVTSNTAVKGGGIYNGFTATLHNTIVALNSATSSGNDLFGGATGGIAYTGTYNLIGKIDGSTGLESAPNMSGTDLSPLDPRLSPLQNNGGPTLTRHPISASPAFDSGNSTTVATDQRGYDRPVGNGADIGSVEVQRTTAAAVSISGRVFTAEGMGLRNALVDLTDSSGTSRQVRTGSFGYYQFDEIPAGTNYIMGVSAKRCGFAPILLVVIDTLTDVDMVCQD